MNLFEACKKGDLERVKYLVEQGANIYAKYNCALSIAAYYGHLELVKYLVEQGANIHADDDYALKWAVIDKYHNIVMYLRKIAGKKWKCHECIVRSTCMTLCEGWNKNEII